MKLCPYCKVALERDDARFCQNCGKPNSSHFLSTTASSSALSAGTSSELLEDTLHVPAVKKPRKGQNSLPEQIAQQPEPIVRTSAVGSHVSEKKEVHSDPLPDTATTPLSHIEQLAQEWPVQVEKQHPAVTSSGSSSDERDSPGPASSPMSHTPSSPVSQEPVANEQPAETDVSDGDAIDERPTALLELDASEVAGMQQTTAEERQDDGTAAENKEVVRSVLVRPIPARFSAFPDDDNRLTSQRPSVVQPLPPPPFSLAASLRQMTSSIALIGQKALKGLVGLSVAIRKRLSTRSDSIRLSRLPSFFASAVLQARRRWSMPLVAAIIVGVVLVGACAWLLIDQPFSVPQVTRPSLGFSDAHMGISLSYPNGWSTQKNASDAVVQFSDSSHTALVIIAVSSKSNTPINVELQKQSIQSGLSDVKNVASLSFAGESWQGVQGTVQQNGASYTCTIFATRHANQLIVLTQMAPQSIYNQEDSLVFSALRQSLQFV